MMKAYIHKIEEFGCVLDKVLIGVNSNDSRFIEYGHVILQNIDSIVDDYHLFIAYNYYSWRANLDKYYFELPEIMLYKTLSTLLLILLPYRKKKELEREEEKSIRILLDITKNGEKNV